MEITIDKKFNDILFTLISFSWSTTARMSSICMCSPEERHTGTEQHRAEIEPYAYPQSGAEVALTQLHNGSIEEWVTTMVTDKRV